MLDFVLIAFLGYLSYCLYIVIIIPYQKSKLHDREKLEEYLKEFSNVFPSKHDRPM